jgi:HSP20 family protein
MAENKETTKATPEVKKGEGGELERWPFSLFERGDGHGPFEIMQRFAEEMDRVFEDFGMPALRRRRPGLLSRVFGREPEARAGLAWAPRVELLEREGQFVIRAELPGLSKDDVKVEVTDDGVTIQGERKEEKKEERQGYYYNECSFGNFYRRIPLSEGTDPSKATAQFSNGVLEVVMPGPKRPEKKSRQLEIKST